MVYNLRIDFGYGLSLFLFVICNIYLYDDMFVLCIRFVFNNDCFLLFNYCILYYL